MNHKVARPGIGFADISRSRLRWDYKPASNSGALLVGVWNLQVNPFLLVGILIEVGCKICLFLDSRVSNINPEPEELIHIND